MNRQTVLAGAFLLGAGIAHAECDPAIVKTDYLAKFADVAEWPVEQLLPYATKLCQIGEERQAAIIEMRNMGAEARSNLFVCRDLGEVDGSGNGLPSCEEKHFARLNVLIDACKEAVTIGHNPHNVGIVMDAASVELACLKGVNLAFSLAN